MLLINVAAVAKLTNNIYYYRTVVFSGDKWQNEEVRAESRVECSQCNSRQSSLDIFDDSP